MNVNWKDVPRFFLVPTLLGAGTGAAMSLVAKPEYRGAIMGTGAGFGALLGLAMFGYSGGFAEKLGPSTPTVGTNGIFNERVSLGAREVILR